MQIPLRTGECGLAEYVVLTLLWLMFLYINDNSSLRSLVRLCSSFPTSLQHWALKDSSIVSLTTMLFMYSDVVTAKSDFVLLDEKMCVLASWASIYITFEFPKNWKRFISPLPTSTIELLPKRRPSPLARKTSPLMPSVLHAHVKCKQIWS